VGCLLFLDIDPLSVRISPADLDGCHSRVILKRDITTGASGVTPGSGIAMDGSAASRAFDFRR
jgi:hypothetical protein